MANDGKPGLIARLLGGGSKANTLQKGLEKDFAFLAHVDPKLPGQVVQYILTGEGRMVLGALDAQKTTISQIPRQHMPQGYGMTWGILGGALSGMLRAQQYATVARLAEASAHGLFAVRSLSFHFRNDPFSLTVAVALGMLQEVRTDRQSPYYVGHEGLMAILEPLGGTHSDLIVLSAKSYNGHLAIVYKDRQEQQRAAFSGGPAQTIEGISRLDAAGKVSAIEAMTEHGLSKDPAYADFLLDSVGAGSAKVRDAARGALKHQDQAMATTRATEMLSAGKVALRTSAVQILGDIRSEAARAALADRLEVEKAQSVRALIEQVLALTGAGAAAEGDQPDPDFDIPPVPKLSLEGSEKVLTPAEVDELLAIDAKHNKDARARAAASKAAGHKYYGPTETSIGKDMVAVFNKGAPLKGRGLRGNGVMLGYARSAEYDTYFARALDRLSPDRAVYTAILGLYQANSIFSTYEASPQVDKLRAMLQSGQMDLRTYFLIFGRTGLRLGRESYNKKSIKPEKPEDWPATWLRQTLEDGPGLSRRAAEFVGADAIWPLVAENIQIVAEYLPPSSLSGQENEAALNLLRLLPRLPQWLIQPVLFVAMGEARGPRVLAREMLQDVPGIDDTIAAALTDKRQAIRANAASFLAQRGAKDALPALKKRLKTEKSEMARAAMISALAELGGDTDAYLGKKALMDEAAKLVTKLPNAKIDWLHVDQAPALKWASGGAVDPVIVDAWARLAVKLKDPGEGKLWALYFDQLDPASAEALSGWALSSWIAYDTWRKPRAELEVEATQEAQNLIANSPYYKRSNYTVETLAAQLIAYRLSDYPHSGADSKGLLSLTHRAPAVVQARQIAAYLKDHGKRTSQAKAMIDVLFASATSEAIQVLVATATRFKQRSVREYAETRVAALAESKGWTRDQLADRSVPTGGLEDGGVTTLDVGEERKAYSLRLASDLTLKLFNPDGKEVKSLPAGKDDTTKDSKALLSQAKKTVKTVTTQQSSRLYEAMMAQRNWSLEDWRADLNDHPILSRLTERVVWRGLDGKGAPLCTFRPTPEADLFDAEGDDADLTGVAIIDVAHAANLSDADRAAWTQHLEDFEVLPLFAQFSRPVLTAEDSDATKIVDREGWLMDTFKLRGATSKLGYDRGPVEDGAGFNLYRKAFQSADLTAEIEFTGSYLPEENLPAALIEMRFVKGTKTTYGSRALKLSEVPALLLSECWNDWHEIAGQGAFDPEWRKKGLY